jgi:flagellar basal body P-ring protein FlgI
MRSQSPESEDLDHLAEEKEDLLEYVGDLTIPTGMKFVKIEGPGLVNGLRHTGSDPSPSPLRVSLVGEIQSHSVPNAEQLLASDENSLVVVRMYLPPAVQKGDRLDVEVVVPPKSDTTSLRGGFLFPTRLREMQMQQGAMRSGHVSGLAGGTVVVDALFYGDGDEVDEKRGRILGGGQSQITRWLGLALPPGEASITQSARIGTVINARFHISDRNGKCGVATPKRDNYVELALPPRYKNNISRYMRVVRNIVLRESPGERVLRIEALERQLLEPTTAAAAAIRLEAIGDEAAHVLLKGLESPDREVRFYAAEALAYLDRAEAAPVLAETALNVFAFRWHALTALAAMDHVQAYEALNELLHVPSSETRYGAFRALRTRNAADPLVRGEWLGEEFAFHLISTNGPPMVHISKAHRPEIVVFGPQQPVVPPAFLFAGKEIMIKGLADGRLKLTRFDVGDEDRTEFCDATVEQMIRGIVKMGGSYADVMEALQEARQGGYLNSKLVVNALARPDREYHRDGPDAEPDIKPASPVPNLFADRLSQGERKQRYLPDEILPPEDEKEESDESFMGRMWGWFRR